MLFKILLVLTLVFVLFRGTIRRRWPNLGRKIQTVLITSLIVITAYRLFIWLQHRPDGSDPPRSETFE